MLMKIIFYLLHVSYYRIINSFCFFGVHTLHKITKIEIDQILAND